MTNSYHLGVVTDGLSPWLSRMLAQEGYLETRLEEAPLSDVIPMIFSLRSSQGLRSALADPRVVTIVTSHKFLSRLVASKFKRVTASRFELEHGSNFAMNRHVFSLGKNFEAHLVSRGWSHYTRKGKKIQGSGVIAMTMKGKNLISLPWDLSKLPEAKAGLSQYFNHNPGTDTQYREISNGTDIRALRQIVGNLVEYSFAFSQLPLLKVSKFPKSGPHLILRIDADGHSKKSTAAILSVSKRLDAPFTWFIDTKNWVGAEEDLLAVARASEVALHCFHHMTFFRTRDNLENLRLGTENLKLSGIVVNGAASPLGMWTLGYMRALKNVRFRYSSEFALSEEDLPFFPKDDRSGALQIPVGTGSAGVLTDPSGLRKYWQQTIDRQLADCGVAIIYDHPLDRLEHHSEDLMHELNSQIQKGATFITMGEYADLWLSRPQILNARYDDYKVWYTLSQTTEASRYQVLESQPRECDLGSAILKNVKSAGIGARSSHGVTISGCLNLLLFISGTRLFDLWDFASKRQQFFRKKRISK